MRSLRPSITRGIHGAFWLVIAVQVLGGFFLWVTGRSEPSIREGQPCGPGFAWTTQQAGVSLPDLSCEPAKGLKIQR